MNTVPFTLGGEQYDMPLTHAVLLRVATEVRDPLTAYARSTDPLGFMLTGPEVLRVLVIGCRAAGAKLSEEQLAEAIMAQGLASVSVSAMHYFAALVAPSPRVAAEHQQASGGGGEPAKN